MKAFVLLVLALLFSGCTAHVFSPPAMGGTLETVKPLAESEMRVGARVGGADVSLFHIEGVEQADKDLRLEILEHYMALQGGVGGGFSDAGQFVSPDLGIILAIENPHLVPFVNVSGFVSQPINPKAVDVSNADEPLRTNVQEPKLTS